MAKAYSNDLRRKLLAAYDRGEGSLRELAERFAVSSPYAWKISAQRLRTGQVERVEQRHGPESKVTPEVEQQLRSWVRQQPDLILGEIQERLWEALSKIDPARLVFLDESGVTTEMTRRYGRAPSGERVQEATPAGHWSTLTLLGALTSQGVLASRTIEAAGATLLYLPPYWPDFNPIETAWSKIKQQLRKTKARTLERLADAVAQALANLTSQDAHGWFRHCGYAIH